MDKSQTSLSLSLKSQLAIFLAYTHNSSMQRQNRHEWRETIEDETHLFRGIFYGSDWEITTCIRISRRETTEWETIENPPLEIWKTLRDIVWRKYQRKRLPWRIVEDLDGIIEGLSDSKKQDSTPSSS